MSPQAALGAGLPLPWPSRASCLRLAFPTTAALFYISSRASAVNSTVLPWILGIASGLEADWGGSSKRCSPDLSQALPIWPLGPQLR
jgi:hypothetical protein